MSHPVSTLLARSLAQQLQRNAAAVAAIESRSGDLAQLERLVAALRARGWKAEPYVNTTLSGEQAVCELALLLSYSEPELCDGGDGFSRACDMAVAAVEFSFRETLRLPVDELVPVEEEKA